MTGQARYIMIVFHSSLRHGAPHKMKRFMRMSRVLAVQSESATRFQDSEYFRKGPPLVFNPMKNAIQINDVKARIWKFGQILGSTDPRLKIGSGLRFGDFDPQR